MEGFGRGVVQWFWAPESHLLLRFVAILFRTSRDLEGVSSNGLVSSLMDWPCIFFRGVPREAALYLL